MTTGLTSQLIGGIIRPLVQTVLGPSQLDLKTARKIIRMAGNYGETYETITDRIRTESARYKAFKQNPQTIARVTLIIKRIDSNAFSQHHYEITESLQRQNNRGNTFLSYTHQRSPNTVLEFFLDDRNYLPLFAIARTYCDWIGYKEFDLGKNAPIFYLEMVEAKNPGYLHILAGFKTRQHCLSPSRRLFHL